MAEVKPGSPEATILINAYEEYLESGINTFDVKPFRETLKPPLNEKEIQKALRFLEIEGCIERIPEEEPIAESFKINSYGLSLAHNSLID